MTSRNKTNGTGTAPAHAARTPATPAQETRPRRRGDPIYDIPLVGRLIEEADRLRGEVPLGAATARREADLLAAQARGLRLLASQLDHRANQLRALARDSGPSGRPRITRVRLE